MGQGNQPFYRTGRVFVTLALLLCLVFQSFLKEAKAQGVPAGWTAAEMTGDYSSLNPPSFWQDPIRWITRALDTAIMAWGNSQEISSVGKLVYQAYETIKGVIEGVSSWIDKATMAGIIDFAWQRLSSRIKERAARAEGMLQVTTKAAERDANIAAENYMPTKTQLACAQNVVVGALPQDAMDLAQFTYPLTMGVAARGKTLGGNSMAMADATVRQDEMFKDFSPIEEIPDYTDATTKGSDGSVSARKTTFPISKNLVYEFVPYEGATYTDPTTGKSFSVMVPKGVTTYTGDQKFFMMARDSIYKAAGMRPVPPAGDGLQTPEGRRKRAVFDHCTAMQDVLIDSCMNWLGFLTRPPTTDSNFEAKRKKQKENCANYEGIFDLKEFDYCDKGLSIYEEQLMLLHLCKAPGFAQGARAYGATNADLSSLSRTCSLGWRNWKNLVEAKETNCQKAMKILSKMTDCWP